MKKNLKVRRNGRQQPSLKELGVWPCRPKLRSKISKATRAAVEKGIEQAAAGLLSSLPIVPDAKGSSSVPVPVDERIHHPVHYNTSDIEHCEMVEAMGHADGYYFGQVTKYLFRMGTKPGSSYFQKVNARPEEFLEEGRTEDMGKAHWYMARWLAWRKHGKAIWKFVRRNPEIVFEPKILAEKVASGS